MAGRLVDVVKEIKDVTTDRKLARTFFASPGNTPVHPLLIQQALNALICQPIINSFYFSYFHITKNIFLSFFPVHLLAFLLLCAPLAPPSGKWVLLWPVLLLLLNRARCVWPPQGPGGLLGCHATRSLPGKAQDLEISVETFLQPKQAGKVSGRPGLSSHTENKCAQW